MAADWTIRQAWTILRGALSNAVREELISRNVAALVRVAIPRPKRARPWTVDEARQFLASARADRDPLYTAFVLLLILGLRRGEVLGLAWEDVDLEKGEAKINWQVQRVEGRLLRRKTKTVASEAPLPLPGICVSALTLRQVEQEAWQEKAGDGWQDSGLDDQFQGVGAAW